MKAPRMKAASNARIVRGLCDLKMVSLPGNETELIISLTFDWRGNIQLKLYYLSSMTSW